MSDSPQVVTSESIDSQISENNGLSDIHKERPWLWKPGQSGNPGGRPKKLTRYLDVYLDAKDKNGKTKAEKFVKSIVERAMKKSDILAKEVWERAEGKMPSEEKSHIGVQVVVMSGR